MQCRAKMLPLRCVGRRFWSKVRGGLCSWRRRSALPRASVEIKQYPCWASPECHWRLLAVEPLLQPHRYRTFIRRTPQLVSSSRSARKKSPTSACRPSMCSTRSLLQRHKAKRSPGAVAAVAVAAVAVVPADAEAVAGTVAGAADAALAAFRGAAAAGRVKGSCFRRA
jgi:hypothetical protein